MDEKRRLRHSVFVWSCRLIPEREKEEERRKKGKRRGPQRRRRKKEEGRRRKSKQIDPYSAALRVFVSLRTLR